MKAAHDMCFLFLLLANTFHHLSVVDTPPWNETSVKKTMKLRNLYHLCNRRLNNDLWCYSKRSSCTCISKSAGWFHAESPSNENVLFIMWSKLQTLRTCTFFGNYVQPNPTIMDSMNMLVSLLIDKSNFIIDM